MAHLRGQDGEGLREDAGFESIIARFEAACWQAAEDWPRIADYARAGDGEVQPQPDQALLIELAHVDLELRRKRGRAIELTGYLKGQPELAAYADVFRAERASLKTAREAVAATWPETQAGVLQPTHFGRFELIERVGSGGCGVVFRARDPELDRLVALKLPRASLVDEEARVDRFLRESRMAARIRHPAIVSVFEAGRLSDQCYLVCEFIEGPTLAKLLETSAPCAQESARLISEVAHALDHAHRQGVIHRDIKPTNILIDQEGRPHLADFGLAKSLTDEETMTQDGALLGTPAYMSPEQARGDGSQVNTGSDIYSLGVVLYEALTLVRPFRGHPQSILRQIIDQEPQAPRRLNPAIPLDLESICLKAMANDPSGRYATAGELANDLDRYLRGEPVKARPAGLVQRAYRLAKRRPALAGLAAGLVLATGMGFAGVTWQWRQARAGYAAEQAQNTRLNHALYSANQVIGSLVRIMSIRQQEDQGVQPSIDDKRLKVFTSSFDMYLRTIREEPRSSAYQGTAQINLARIYELAGQDEQALRAWKDAADTCLAQYRSRTEPSNLSATIRAWAGLAATLGRVGSREDAVRAYEKLLGFLQLQKLQTPGDESVEQQLNQARDMTARIRFMLGKQLLEMGENASARVHLERSLKVDEQVAQARPAAWELRRLWSTQVHLGRALDRLECYQEAHDIFKQAVATMNRLIEIEPNLRNRSGLAMCEHVLGNLLEDLGRPDEAIKAFQRCVRLRIQVAREAPGESLYVDQLNGSKQRLAEVVAASGLDDSAMLDTDDNP